MSVTCLPSKVSTLRLFRKSIKRAYVLSVCRFRHSDRGAVLGPEKATAQRASDHLQRGREGQRGELQ